MHKVDRARVFELMSEVIYKMNSNVIKLAEPDLLLEVKNLSKHFTVTSSKKILKAVDDVSFGIQKNKIVGLVGESGSGKTTLGRSILRLIEPTSGQVHFGQVNVTKLNNEDMRLLRKEMQIIFQDPYSSLNPRMRVREIIGEAITAFASVSQKEQDEIISDLLVKVGLSPEHINRFPHEFSGGQRQRIGIARALATNPKFIVADESVSALDVSVQAQILNLLKDLQKELNLTILFIAHDLAVVEYLCDEVIVMYLGKVMEILPTSKLIDGATHPYTKALLSAAPVPIPNADRNRIILNADIPSPLNAPSGCVFRTRCPSANELCSKEVPLLRPVAQGHLKACLRDDLN